MAHSGCLMKRIAVFCGLVIMLMLFPSVVFAAALPQPTQDFYVNDFANVLSAETEQMIIKDSAVLQQKTGAQIVVVTISSLDGQALETYSLNLLREWGIGDKVKNNGVLILLSLNDRLSRIEVGYGLEGPLPDGKTGRIQDDYMLPYYQKGQYDEGIKNGYLALLKEVAAEYELDVSTIETGVPSQPASNSSSSSSDWPIIIIGGLAILFIILRGRRFGGGGGFYGGGGGFYGGGGGFSGGGGAALAAVVAAVAVADPAGASNIQKIFLQIE